MRHPRARRTARGPVLGAVALLAALSLTACGGGDTSASDEADSSVSADGSDGAADTSADTAGDGAEDRVATEGQADTDAGAEPEAGSGEGTDAGSGSGGASGGACDGANTEVVADIMSRPVNHVLLTITNTGSTACDAYAYPGVGYEGAQAVMDFVKESVPQSVVSLEPGQSAYASVRTAAADGSGEGGAEVSELTVDFQDASGFGNGTSANASLGQRVTVDSSAAVTYWSTDLDAVSAY
ncbi:DUF4232 domain-containing protein [Streptomyces sp. NPDC060184]|uniref:DUF4232 domain-containing protein n=1 Tax=Streptomyces sp. NPDC060184 TaxID=3347064 RepID=UPI00364F55C8